MVVLLWLTVALLSGGVMGWGMWGRAVSRIQAQTRVSALGTKNAELHESK